MAGDKLTLLDLHLCTGTDQSNKSGNSNLRNKFSSVSCHHYCDMMQRSVNIICVFMGVCMMVVQQAVIIQKTAKRET